jgi:hypothetical protein
MRGISLFDASGRFNFASSVCRLESPFAFHGINPRVVIPIPVQTISICPFHSPPGLIVGSVIVVPRKFVSLASSHDKQAQRKLHSESIHLGLAWPDNEYDVHNRSVTVINCRQFHVPRGRVGILLGIRIQLGWTHDNETRLRERLAFTFRLASPSVSSLVYSIHGGNK